MYKVIKNFSSQFAYEPVVENSGRLGKYKKFVVVGMGGSNLTTGLLQLWKPELAMVIHLDYGLPMLSAEIWKETLVIASSYSGNTEEPLDGFKVAGEKGLARAAISVGGKLLEEAKKEGVPYIQLPDTGIQPRSAAGFSFLALLTIMGEKESLEEARSLHLSLHPEDYEDAGQEFAEKLKGFIPLIYASSRNEALAHNWKVRFNETAKIPAFYNIFPELNHNEMTGFDIQNSTQLLSQNFLVIILKDKEDHPRIQKRMEMTAELYKQRGLPVEFLEISGKSKLLKIFSSLILADWVAYYMAEQYGVEAEEVPMVEEFKKMMA